jgi:hypothetical protein
MGDATFILFPKFPIELRKMIWHYSLSSRLIELFWDESIGVCKSSCPPPAALSVNKESREVALGCYKLCFGTSQAPAKIYFDMTVDELYLGIGNIVASSHDLLDAVSSALAPEDLSQIRHLIIDDDIFQEDDPLPSTAYQGLAVGLQSVTIIDPESCGDFVSELVNIKPVERDVWLFGEDGRTRRWPDRIVQEGGEQTWEVKDEFASEEFEKLIVGPNGFRTLSRFVTQERLKEDERWAKRMDFLQKTVLWDNGCLYARDGLMEKLIDMEDQDPDKYGKLSLLVSGRSEWVLDPLLVYTCQTTCVCAVGHKKKFQGPDWFPDISGVDLRALLKKVEGTGSS